MTKRNGFGVPRLGRPDMAFLEEAIRRGASRRDLLGWFGALGIGAAAGTTLFGAAGQALAETPKHGGKARISGYSSSTTDTLDPAKGSNSTDYSRHLMFYNGLTYLDESLTPQLELAESIENDKATVWTIKLRRDVKFHDGSPLTAQDVVYSLGRHKDPSVGSKAKALAEQMAEVKASGPNEVTIRLGAPNADLPVILGTFALPHRQGRHDRLQHRHRHRPLQAARNSSRACARSVVRNDELFPEARQALPRRDRVRRHRRRLERPRQRAACRATSWTVVASVQSDARSDTHRLARRG